MDGRGKSGPPSVTGGWVGSARNNFIDCDLRYCRLCCVRDVAQFTTWTRSLRDEIFTDLSDAIKKPKNSGQPVV